MSSRYIIGMMSGTSADGVDAALVHFDDSGGFKVVRTEFTPYSVSLQEQVNSAAHTNKAQLGDPKIQVLHTALAKIYAQAALDVISNAELVPSAISAIANHGQTVAHRPKQNPPESLQIGDPQLIADLTSIPVISQFRQADLAAGGQGAPLMPAFHQVLINASDPDREQSERVHGDVFVLNLGGIANISAMSRDDSSKLFGFDTGPANTLLNQWIKKNNQVDYDEGGAWAQSGTPDADLLADLLEDPYFKQDYPKSTGPDYFNLEWLARLSGDLSAHKLADIQATLHALTVESIAIGLDQIGASSGSLYVCGGGANNGYLMESLELRLPGFEVLTTDCLGVSPDWIEAVGFAWLGQCYLSGDKSSCPSVTGASESVVLGERYSPKP